MVAWLIDGAIIFAFYIVIWILALVLGAVSDALGAIVLIVGYLAAVGYSFWIYYLNGATGSPAASYIFMGVALFASVWLTLIVKPANNQNLPLGAHHA